MTRVTRYLALLVLPYVLLSGAFADSTPARIMLGASEAPLAPAAIFDGNHVLAPLGIFKVLGASYTESSDGDKVSVTTAGGQTGDIPTTEINDTKMVPMDKVTSLVGADYVWDGDRHTLKLLAHLTSVEFDNNTLRVNCSYPVPSSVIYWDGKVILDIPGTKIATDAKEVFIGTSTVLKARLGEPTATSSRVVLDLAKSTGYKLVTSGPSAQIELQVGDGIGQPAPAAKSAPTPRPKQPAVPPFTITGISVDTANDDAFDVIIRTTNRGNIGADLAILPPEIVLNLPGGKLDDSVTDVTGSHPNLKSATISKASGSVSGIRLTLRLARPMAYGVEIKNNEINVHVRPPDRSGGLLADKFIVVDPGHGGSQKGAQAGGCNEKDVNFKIAKAVKAALEAEGAKVMLTRDRDEDIGLSARSEVAIDNKADFFIAVHCNSSGASDSVTGIETYYHMQEPSPKVLAYAVHAGVCASTGMCDRRPRSDRSLYMSGLAVLRRLENSGIPGILVECGYIDNSSDRAKLLTKDYQDKLAAGIVAGLRAYVEGTPIQTEAN